MDYTRLIMFLVLLSVMVAVTIQGPSGADKYKKRPDSQGDKPERPDRPTLTEDQKKMKREKAQEMKDARRKMGEASEKLRPDMTFRSFQAEQMWKMAQQKHEGAADTLASVKRELTEFDEMEASVRQLSKDKQDPDGKMVQQLRETLMAIGDRYELKAPKNPKDRPNPKDRAGKAERPPRKDPNVLRDTKLVEFWNKVSNMDFAGEDLNLLREELVHYQAKIDEFEMLTNGDELFEIFKALSAEKLMRSKDLVGDFPELQKFGKDNKKLEKQRARFVRLQQTLISGVERLDLLTNDTAKEQGWTQPVVAQIWEEAQNGNFTEDEQESLRVELFHLQEKVEERLKLEIEMDKHRLNLPGVQDKKDKYAPKPDREAMKEKAGQHKSLSQTISGSLNDIKLKVKSKVIQTEL